MRKLRTLIAAVIGLSLSLAQAATCQAQSILRVALANIVRSGTVPAAMVKAFEAEPDAPLALRLINALEAGDAAGGEFKPLMSAGLIVAYRELFPYVDLRVDSDVDPIKTMRRLWREYEPVADTFVARAVHPASVVGG